MRKSELNQSVAWALALSLSVNLFGGGYFFLSGGLSLSAKAAKHKDHGEESSHQEGEHPAEKHREANEGHEVVAEHDESHEVAAHDQSEQKEHGAKGEETAAEHGVSASSHEPEKSHEPGKPAAPHWAYEGALDAKHWAKLDESFALCESGHKQSPIDILPASAKAGHARIEFHYEPGDLVLTNNGHTIQANLGAGSYILHENVRYELAQFHFHNPSEHRISGHAAPLEVHLVHKNKKGELAVVGVLFKESGSSKALSAMWSHLPKKAGSEYKVKDFDVASLLPADESFYHYSGSLTTPPCSEGVKWFVMKMPMPVSTAQAKAFNHIFPLNARPTQPLSGRNVSSNGEESLAH